MNRILIMIFLMMNSLLYGQEEINWEFPYTIENGRLRTLNGHIERVDSCQIPENILINLSTNKLAKLCLEYPLFEIMTAHNNLQTGYNQVVNEFNGFDELFKRDDACEALILLYKTNKINKLDNLKTNIEIGRYRARIFKLEFLLSDERIIEKLSDDQVQDLLSETLVKLKEKNERNIHTFRVLSTPLVMARILNSKNLADFRKKKEKKPNYEYFTNSAMLANKEMITEINDITKAYLNK